MVSLLDAWFQCPTTLRVVPGKSLPCNDPLRGGRMFRYLQLFLVLPEYLSQ